MKYGFHPSNNFIFRGNGSGIGDLPTTVAFSDRVPGEIAAIASFWKPSPEELAVLNSGGSVMVTELANCKFPMKVEVVAEAIEECANAPLN
jgi:hypothetical protein